MMGEEEVRVCLWVADHPDSKLKVNYCQAGVGCGMACVLGGGALPPVPR